MSKLTDDGKAQRRRELIWFIVIAYGISFCFWTPVMLATIGVIDWVGPVNVTWASKLIHFQFSSMTGTDLIIILGGLGPISAATIVSYRYRGISAVKSLFARVVQVKMPPWWYLAPLSLFFIGLAAAGLEYLFAGSFGIRGGDSLAALLPGFVRVVAVVTVFIILEETGWRGFMLPRLQADYSALWSSVVAGLSWSFWHLPYFFALGYLADGAFGGLFMVLAAPITRIPISILITWTMNSVGGSIFICMVFHATKSATGTVFDLESLYYGIVLYAVTLAVIKIFGAENLSRRPKFVIQ